MIDADYRERLTRLASDSIEYGVRHGAEMEVDTGGWPPELRETRASFVTLQIKGHLRGCIGSLVATRPLVRDVSHHAYAAAFEDPRFSAVTSAELDRLEIHISVLSVPTPIPFDTESELLDRIRPGVDGLVLKEGARRATFLPDVWGKLPDPRQFLSQLKLKAGLAGDHWSDSLVIERYTTESW
jgi:AmmeMemoRadiSam system protein A